MRKRVPPRRLIVVNGFIGHLSKITLKDVLYFVLHNFFDGKARPDSGMSFNDASGRPVVDTGKYVTVWHKRADGSWKAVADIFNSDLPAKTETPPHQRTEQITHLRYQVSGTPRSIGWSLACVRFSMIRTERCASCA